MLLINVKEGESIDKALKRFKKKFERIGAKRELRARKNFMKPSFRNREELKKAIYVAKLRQEES